MSDVRQKHRLMPMPIRGGAYKRYVMLSFTPTTSLTAASSVNVTVPTSAYSGWGGGGQNVLVGVLSAGGGMLTYPHSVSVIIQRRESRVQLFISCTPPGLRSVSRPVQRISGTHLTTSGRHGRTNPQTYARTRSCCVW